MSNFYPRSTLCRARPAAVAGASPLAGLSFSGQLFKRSELSADRSRIPISHVHVAQTVPQTDGTMLDGDDSRKT